MVCRLANTAALKNKNSTYIVGFNSTKRIVSCFSTLRFSQRIEESRLHTCLSCRDVIVDRECTSSKCDQNDKQKISDDERCVAHKSLHSNLPFRHLASQQLQFVIPWIEWSWSMVDDCRISRILWMIGGSSMSPKIRWIFESELQLQQRKPSFLFLHSYSIVCRIQQVYR